jgi:hypothetical protein
MEVDYDKFYAQRISMINMALSGFPSCRRCASRNFLPLCLGKFSRSRHAALSTAHTSQGHGMGIAGIRLRLWEWAAVHLFPYGVLYN